MRIAIIGTGFIAAYHRDALRALGLSPAVIVSRSPAQARAFAPEAEAAPELTEALLQQVDCVLLCTPPAAHFDAAAMCLRAGKHLFCEKPLCLDVGQARELARLAEDSPALAAVDFNNRFYPGTRRMRALAEGVQFVRGTYLQAYHLLPAPYSWRYTDPMRAVTEIGSHLFDLISYVTGERITAVRARFYNRTPHRVLRSDGLMYEGGAGEPITVSNEDEAAVDFTLSGGGGGRILLSEIAPGHENDLTLELTTPKGRLCWTNQKPHTLLCFGTAVRDGVQGDFRQTFSDALGTFLACAEQGTTDDRLCSFREAARNVGVCDAALRSARGACEAAVEES